MKKILLIKKHLTRILPLVEQELKIWENQIEKAPSSFLRGQGLKSLMDKKFHCMGGSVFALRTEQYQTEMVRLIVSVQTISDYLDNLCDRGPVQSETCFYTLHQSLIDVFSHNSPGNYYQNYPLSEDNNYLQTLVNSSKQNLEKLPQIDFHRDKLLYLAGLYSDLQVYKHLSFEKRVPALQKWFSGFKRQFPDLYWWEFSCAAGSTLGIFALLSLATEDSYCPVKAKKILHAYFPWICGLHILLDYFIDQEEDLIENDLNFVAFYPDQKTLVERIELFISRSFLLARSLPDPNFHLAVIKGLLAMYLSDGKIRKQGFESIRKNLLKKTGPEGKILYYLCYILRRKKGFKF